MMPQYSHRFQSTALSHAGYDTDSQSLDITFVSGRSYTYENVPEHVWEGLVSARSAGGYFREQIKDRY